MKIFAKILSCSVLVIIFALHASAQKNSWVGNYEFDENGGKTAGGTVIFIAHQLEIKETDEGLMATLQSNGYQTSKDLLCKAKVTGNKLLLYFESYGENNIFETYESGDLLLTLERKTVKKKPVILTYWNKFTPAIEKNEKSGKVYFKKTNN